MARLRSVIPGFLLLSALFAVAVPALAAIDSAPPATSATLSGTLGSDGWYTTAVTVTLTASDGTGGSGVAKTEYSLDNVTWLPYSAPFVLDNDAAQFVYFRSTDFAGNLENPAKSQKVQINKSGLVGLWHMDNDWSDASIVGNHGTANNGAGFSLVAQVGTHAGSFDGVNDYVSIPSSGTLSPSSAVSVEAWVKPGDVATWHQVVTKRYSETSNPYNSYILASNNGGTSNKWIFAISEGSVGSLATATDSDVIAANAWTHLVGTYDGAAVRLYVNGVLKATASKSGNIGYSSLPCRIGTSNTFSGQFFKGLIDEVGIYNRALSPTEIQDHYRRYAVKPPTVNPVPSPTATPAITLSGTKVANTAIVVNGKTLVPADGATTWQASYTLSAGTNSLAISAQNSQNVSSPTVILAVVLDATPPQVTATTTVNDAVVKSAPASISFTLADDISALDFATTVGGATATTAGGSNIPGIWSSSGSGTTGTVTFTPTSSLGDGAYKLAIHPTDTLANSSTYTLTFTVDSTPPVAPGIVPVTTINTTSTTITGTKSSDSIMVTVGCAGATIGTPTYPTATTWVVNIWGLQTGGNTVTAYATDAAGNRSGLASAAINVDTTPPAVDATPAAGTYNSTQSVALAASEDAVIYYTTDGSTPTTSAAIYSKPILITVSQTLKYFGRDLAGNDSDIKTQSYVIDTAPPQMAVSTVSDGAYTNNQILNVAGTVTDNTGVQGITVNDAAVQVTADGTFSYPLLLQNGVNTIKVVATDTAGNVAEDTRQVTLDQTAPVLAVASPADNSKTAKGLLEVSGTVDKTSTVTVKVKDVVQSALMDGAAFTATVMLESGYNTIEIVATDLAGNRSSEKRTAVFDDQVPSLAVTVPNQDIRSNQQNLTIIGTVNDQLTAARVTINVDNLVYTPPVVDGAFQQAIKLSEEKPYAIVVTATNEVGTTATVQRNVIYDITPPTLSINPVTSPSTQSTLSVTGTREPGSAVTVTCMTATVGEISYPSATTWQADMTCLRPGENVITATSADAAGNAVTATAAVVLVERPPQITLSATPDIIWPPNHKMVPVTITGGVAANGADIRSVSISLSDEYGKYRYSNLKFGSTVMLEAWREGGDKDGRTYTISVVVTDNQGKTTTKSATVIVPHSH